MCVLDWGCWTVGQLHVVRKAASQQLIYDRKTKINIIGGARSICAVRACAGYIPVGATLMPLRRMRGPKRPQEVGEGITVSGLTAIQAGAGRKLSRQVSDGLRRHTLRVIIQRAASCTAVTSKCKQVRWRSPIKAADVQDVHGRSDRVSDRSDQYCWSYNAR